jgi:hypothetical protein
MELTGRTTLTCPVVDDTAPRSERPPRSTMIPPAPSSWIAEIRGRDLEQEAADDAMFCESEDERDTLKRGIPAATTTWRCPQT